ncbi:MAG TPA: hypothetical protein VGF21_02265 [Thermoleophilaceae bacterium]
MGFVVLGGETPDPDASARNVVSFYTDNGTIQIIAAAVIALSTVPLLLFAATLRERARAALPDRSLLPTFAFAAGVVTAGGFLVAAATHFAVADLADEIQPAAAQALNALDSAMFIPFSLGVATLVLATSLTALRSALLPRWMGWVGVVLFVVAWTPVGFLAFALSGIWIIVASIVLYRRGNPARSEIAEMASARPAHASMPS